MRNSIDRSSHSFYRAFIIAAVLLFSANGWAGNFPVFGPKSYVRGTGAPVTVTDTFTVQNPSGQFTLHLSNGGLQDDTSEFVSSTVIILNGVEVVAPNDLNQNIATLDKTVQLQATNTISVQVRGKPGGQIAIQILGIDNVPPVITAQVSPAPNAAGWNNTNVTVTFTCTDDFSGVATCPAPVTVTTEGANQIVSGTATDKAGNSAGTSVALKIDKTPPSLTIASPANNSTVNTASVQLTGTASDALSGIASTTCNGTAVVLQSNAFNCSVTLVSGANSIAVVATDVAGNTTTQPLSITFTAGGQPSITDFNPKSAPVGTLITVTGNNLAPASGSSQVTLNQQGGGTIAAPVSNSSSSSLSFVIPSGASTGPITITTGNQSAVSVTSLSVVARSSFGLTAAPAAINVMQGKTGVYSVNLSSSSGFTQLASLNVTGAPAGVTAGFLPAQITAGQSSNLTLSVPAATATGNTTLTISASSTVDGIPSTQSTTVSLVVQPVTTSLFGRTVDSDTKETSLGGITITMLGVDDVGNKTGCTGQTVSDAAGNFSFTNLPNACVGRQLVAYNGNTATDGEKYASVNLAYTLVAGQATGPEIVHLPEITDAETVMVKQNAPNDQTFTFKTMPGLSVTVYAGTIFTLPDGTQPDPFPFEGVQVPVDRLPDTPIDGPGALRAYIIAFQPADSTTNFPVPVTFPNTLNTPPGVNMELDTLDPVRGELVKYGTGTVSGEGASIVPDLDPANPGKRFGIQHFDWHGPMSPSPNGNNPGPDPNGPAAGDPVDPASGLFVLNKTDVIFSSARGQVAINRTYRTLSGTPGPFGVGTSHNYSYQLNTFSFIQGQGFITLIMPDGNQFQFIQQPDRTFVNNTIPSLRGAVLTAASPNFMLRYKDGTTFTFQNPPTGSRVAYLSSIKDRNGNTTTLVRGNQIDPIQITQIIDPVGRQLNLSYDNFDRITSIADPIGRVVSYAYNAQGTLASVTDAGGGVTQYEYDSQNLMTSITDARGITYLHNTYDSNGKVLQQLAADGGITQFSYTLLNPNSSVSLGTGSTSINTSPVLLTTVTNPLGNQQTYHYTPQGFLIDSTDALGQKTIYERDAGTNLVLSVTDPLNRVTALAYDATGNVISSTLMAGTAEAATTTFTYDPIFNKITSITNPLGFTSKMTYDPTGNLTSTTDPLGQTTSMTYDAFGELLSITNPVGNSTSFTYSNGNLVTTTDPLGVVTSQSSDAVGRLASSTTALGQTALYSYDAFNNVSKIVNAIGGVTSFSHDANGNLLSVTDPSGHTTSFTYDVMDRQRTRTDPLSRQQTYSYDLNGNLTEVIDRRGSVTRYRYDALSRRISSQFGVNGNAVESSVNYTFDVASRVVQVNDSQAGVIIHKYDDFNRLIAENTPSGTVNFAYDPADRLTSLTVLGQAPASYTYDNGNRLTSIQQASSSVQMSYDKANRRSALTLPNGIVANYSYDQDSRISSILYQAGSRIVGDLSYAYDPLGRRTDISGSFARTGMPQAIASATYDAANELLNWNGTPISYDNNGNMLSDGNNQFTWNARNELATVNGIEEKYDAFGRRIKDHRNTGFLYAGANSVQELQGTSPVGGRLTGGIDEFFSRTDGSGTSFPLIDALGSTIALTDGQGSVQTSYTFDPFGNTTSTGTQSSNANQFTGRENDGNGLYFYRARYYEPQIARFISEDPLGLAGGANHYSYVGNNPLSYGDPTGLCRVQVNFFQLGPGYYHAYILTTDSQGTSYFRAGPSAGGPSSGSSGAISSGSGGTSGRSCSGSSGSCSSGGSSGSSGSNSSNSSSPGSGGPGPNLGPWGGLHAESGPYGPGTIDYDPGNPPTMTVVDDGLPCSGYNQQLSNAVSSVNSSNIPYNPFSTNSNAFVQNALTWSNLTPGSPPVWVPGWGTTLPH